MKKLISIALIILLTAVFLAAGSTRADAMNNESAALLTAGIVLLGAPVLGAIARGGAYPEPVYVHAGPPRYIERTKVIYVQPRHKRHHRHRYWARPYKRGYRQEWTRQEYREGRRDARRDYRRGRDYDR